MTARGAVARVHLVLAVGLGAMMLLLGVSGAVLVFRDELEPVVPLPAGAAHGGGARVPLQSLLDAAQRSQPGLRPVAVVLPEAEGRPARVAMAGRPGETPEVLVDPRSGAVLAARWRERSPLHALRLLHADLHMGDRGRLAVGVLGVGFLLQGLTGAYLWWPFTRRPASGFGVRWRRSWPVVGYDLHKAVGAASLAFNVPIALTGALLGLAALAPAAGSTDRSATPATSPAGIGRDALSVDAIAARAEAALPGRLVSVVLPGGATPAAGPGAAVVRKALPGDLDRRGTGVVVVDAHTGAVLAVRGGRGTPLSSRLWGLVAPLHHGDFGGTATKLLYAAGGLTAPVLVLTGYAMRLGRRRRPARLRRLADRG